MPLGTTSMLGLIRAVLAIWMTLSIASISAAAISARESKLRTSGENNRNIFKREESPMGYMAFNQDAESYPDREDVLCNRAPFDSGKGPTRAELIKFLESMQLSNNKTDENISTEFLGPLTPTYFLQDLVIDRLGCYQIACIGDRGSLKLCNMQHKRPSFMAYRAYGVQYALKSILHRWSRGLPYIPEWDGVDKREEYINPNFGAEFLRQQLHVYPDRKCDTYWFPDGHDGLDELVTGKERITGTLFVEGEWRINIDEAIGEKCDRNVKFQERVCFSENPSTCTWDYTTGEPRSLDRYKFISEDPKAAAAAEKIKEESVQMA